MKTEDYIKSLIEEKENLKSTCKSHVETIRLIKRELGKLNSEISRKDKKILELIELERNSIDEQSQKELNNLYNNLKVNYDALKLEYNNIVTEKDNLQLAYNKLVKENNSSKNKYNKLVKENDSLKAKYNKVVEENDEYKKIFDEVSDSN